MTFDIYQLDEAGQLFLSPDIHDWAPVLERGIDVVFDLDGGLDHGLPTTPDGILYVYMPFNDSGLPNLKRLHAVGRFGAELINDGHKVLSHCGLGFNRSALVAGVVMKYLGISGPPAVEKIRASRPGALYNEHYAEYLMAGAPQTM